MAKKKPKTESPFLGRWHIVSKSAWDENYLNEVVQAFIEFDDRGGGSFRFGYLKGQTDCRTTRLQGKPAVEFSWEAGDGAAGTPLTGRGWAILLGDESEFDAENMGRSEKARE
jgi:hypothetical protein